MKINLLLDDPGAVRSGYLNVDPCAPDGDVRVRGDVADLGPLVDAGEATEVVALGVLDHLPGHAADGVLRHWLSRLAHGGRLTVGVTDAREVARGVLSGALSIEDANERLCGAQRTAGQFKKSAYMLGQLSGVLESLGYRVLARRIEDYTAVVTVERP